MSSPMEHLMMSMLAQMKEMMKEQQMSNQQTMMLLQQHQQHQHPRVQEEAVVHQPLGAWGRTLAYRPVGQ